MYKNTHAKDVQEYAAKIGRGPNRAPNNGRVSLRTILVFGSLMLLLLALVAYVTHS